MKEKRVSYVCRWCGSSSVYTDAWASWDVEKQDWVLDHTSTTEFCNDCYEETRLLEVELAPASA
jgi:hypothetical protein